MSKKYPLVSSLVRPLVSAVRCGLSEIVGGGQWWNTEYTANLNGINSYVEIPEWKVANSRIEFEFFKSSVKGILLGSVYTWLSYDETGITTYSIWPEGNTITVNGSSDRSALRDGYNTIVVTGTMGSGFNHIGSNAYGGSPSKGQIYNLHLTDLDNPSNSRFYPLIQKGSRTPEGMPDITVAKEMLGEKVHVLGVPSPNLVQNGNSFAVKAASRLLVWGASVSQPSSVSIDITIPVKAKVACGGRYTALLNAGRHQLTMSPLHNNASLEIEGEVTIPAGSVITVHDYSSTTDGTLVNFGTSAPWVPKLGEGEGYVGNVSSGSGWSRGVDLSTPTAPRLAALGTPDSSFKGKGIPSGSVLTALNGVRLQVQSFDTTYYNVVCSRLSGTDEEILEGFQYPNTFTITPPEAD